MSQGDSRPDPDELLARIRAVETRAKRGRLKIFLGYAAGGLTLPLYEASMKNREDMSPQV